MLRWRIVLGLPIIAALVGLCWLDYHAPWPGLYLLPLALFTSLLGAGELIALFSKRADGGRPLAWTIYSGVFLTVLAAGAPVILPNRWHNDGPLGSLGWIAIGLAIGLIISFVGELMRFESPGQSIANLALATFAILYVGCLMGFIVQLRLLGTNEYGMLALVSLIATVKLSDIGQYTVGRLLGHHKLAPRISPGKTWEGVIGGGVFAVSGAWLVIGAWKAAMNESAQTGLGSFTAGPGVSILLFAIAVAGAGIVGDLAESLLKRDVGAKDSSNWLPGFGGVLDLLDSLLVAAPIAYLFWGLALN